MSIKEKLGICLIGAIGFFGLFAGINAQASILQGFQGGTGFGPTVATTSAGLYLQVASTSPFLTYTFATPTSSAPSATTTINGVSGPTFTFSINPTSSASSITTSTASLFLNLLAYTSSTYINVSPTGTILFTGVLGSANGGTATTTPLGSNAFNSTNFIPASTTATSSWVLTSNGNSWIASSSSGGGGSSVGANGTIQLASSTAGGFKSISTVTATGTSLSPTVIIGNGLYSGSSSSSSSMFSYSAATSSFIVPGGTTSVTITAKGSAGITPTSTNAGTGGNGGQVMGTLAVTGGTKLYIGFIAGGAGVSKGGNGGYATWISTSSSFGTSTVLLVAGGGGGGGESTANPGDGGGGGAGYGGGGGGNSGQYGGCAGGTLSNGAGGTGGNVGEPANQACTNGSGGAGGGSGGAYSSGTAGGNGTNGNGVSANGNGGTGGSSGGTGSNSGLNTAGGGGGGGSNSSGGAGGSNGGGGGGSNFSSGAGGGGGAGSSFLGASLTATSSAYSNTATSTAGTSLVISYNAIGGNLMNPITSYGLIAQGHVLYTASSSPSISSCGTGTNIAGSDERGEVYIGAGSPTSCTLTFISSFDNFPSCEATPAVQSIPWVSSDTTSSVTFSFSTTTPTFWYRCDGF